MLLLPVEAVTVTVASGIASYDSFAVAVTVSLFCAVSIVHHVWSDLALQLSMLVVTVTTTLPPAAVKAIGASGASVSSGSGAGSGLSFEQPAMQMLKIHRHHRKCLFIRLLIWVKHVYPFVSVICPATGLLRMSSPVGFRFRLCRRDRVRTAPDDSRPSWTPPLLPSLSSTKGFGKFKRFRVFAFRPAESSGTASGRVHRMRTSNRVLSVASLPDGPVIHPSVKVGFSDQ